VTSQPDLPDLGGGPAFEHALLARAFHLLLDDGRPVSAARLAEAVVGDLDRVAGTLALLDRQGRIRRDQTGAVTGSHGLSLTPTSHELILEHRNGQARRYWTWCAWDAVGILAALDASGQIRSTSPSSGAPIQLDFHHGQPRDLDPELVVFFADTDCCAPASGADDGSDCCGSGSVIDQWCPLVNFFEHADAAQAWAAEHGVRGTAVPLVEATEKGKTAWLRWIADSDQPSEPPDQAGSQP
jgi:alkylmercury lyase